MKCSQSRGVTPPAAQWLTIRKQVDGQAVR
jgi:hypothetical protein